MERDHLTIRCILINHIVDKIDDIVLRNSGTDWNVVHFRDAFMERLSENYLYRLSCC